MVHGGTTAFVKSIERPLFQESGSDNSSELVSSKQSFLPDGQSISEVSIDTLGKAKFLNLNRTIIAYINMISPINKFEMLELLIIKRIDTLLASVAKLETSFSF